MPLASPAFHAALLKTLGKTDFAEAITLLVPLVNEGMVAMDQPMPAPGSSTATRSFFTLWLGALIENKQLPRDEDNWRLIQRWAPTPDFWQETLAPHLRETLFCKWMSSRSWAAFNEVETAVMVEAGPKAWATWTDSNWRRAPDGARLAAYLMGVHNKHGGVDASLPLFENGVSWQAQWMTDDGVSHLASHITTPDQWASYLRHGGDPEMPVLVSEQALTQTIKKTFPLWQALTRAHAATADFKKTVTDSLADRVPDAGNQAKQDEVDKLFAGMNTNNTTRARITATAEQHGVDWTELRDSQGRHVLMPWLRHGRFADFKSLATSQKSHRLLHAVDDQGRNAWAHLLSADNLPTDVQGVMHTAKVPLVLDHKQRGVLFQLEHKDEEGFPAPRAWHGVKLTPKSEALLAQADLWLAAPEAEAAAYLTHRIDRKKYKTPSTGPGEAASFSLLAHLWTRDDQDIGPRWRAAVCINELFTPNPDWAWLGEQIGKGVTLDWSRERSAQLLAQVGPVTTTGNTNQGVSSDRYDRTVAALRLMEASALTPTETVAERRRPRMRT